MKNNPKLSIIIPVFNNLHLIKRCIDSVLNQSYKNMEIIILNGAIDKKESNSLLEEYKKYNNVKIISHPSKLTLFEARLFGFKKATGDYIAYIDSDDEVTIDFYRTIMEKIQETNADIVIGDTLEVRDGKDYYFNYDPILNSDINLNDSECIDFFINKAIYFCRYWNVWNKVYNRKLLELSLSNMETYGQISMGEDMLFSLNLWINAKKIRNVHNVYYKYYIHNSSSTGTSTSYEKFKTNITNLHLVSQKFMNTLTEKTDYKANSVDIWNKYIKYIWNNNINDLDKSKKRQALKLLNEFFPINPTQDDIELFNYYYSEKTEVSELFYKYENIKKSICSNNIKIVSFDIFDTLLKRKVYEPKDIYEMLNTKFNEINSNKSYIYFSKIRTEAEDYCRKSLINEDKEEITLDEIYKTIETKYNISKSVLNQIKNLEEELEIKYSCPRKLIQNLYNLAKYKNKRVICISDMYLNNNTVKTMLSNANYNIDALYLSSEVLLTKESDNIYNYVKEKENVEYNEIVHIGDNYRTDYENASNLEIEAYHIPKIIDMYKNNDVYNSAFFKDPNKQFDTYDSMSFLGNRCAIATVINKVFDSSIVWNINKSSNYDGNYNILGYFPLGLALFSHIYSIYKYSLQNNYNKIHFISRDGYLLNEGYKILQQYLKNAKENNYLYCSRKLLMPLSITCKQDILSLFYSNQNFNISPIKFYEICDNIIAVNKKDYITLCHKYGLNEEMIINDSNKNAFINLLEEIYNENKINEYRQTAYDYYKKIIEPNNLLVDIGYSGRAEAIFTNLLGYNVDSYYIHTNYNVAYDRSRFNNFSINTFYKSRPKLTGIIREYLYMKLDNSCSKIIFNKKDADYVFDNNNFSVTETFVNHAIQNNALEFINDFFKDYSDIINTLNFKLEDLNIFLENFLYNPNNKDAKIFKIVRFDDDFEKKDLKDVNLYTIWTNQLREMNGWTDNTNYINNPSIVYENTKRNIVKRVLVKLFKPLYHKITYRLENIINNCLDNKLNYTNNKIDIVIGQNQNLKSELQKNNNK